jgi:hypothetical protein
VILFAPDLDPCANLRDKFENRKKFIEKSFIIRILPLEEGITPLKKVRHDGNSK